MCLTKPHGNHLINLLIDDDKHIETMKSQSEEYTSITLTKRQLCDLEMLISGALSPLAGYMDKTCYDSVIQSGRLPDNLLWPIPIVLDVDAATAKNIKSGDKIALRDTEGFMPAVLNVSDIWKADKKLEAESVFGTSSTLHPGVDYLLNQSHEYYIGGQVEGIEQPTHFDFEQLWSTPAELQQQFSKRGWNNILAFQTSKPMHKVHQEITLNAARDAQAHILIHPTVGTTKPGDLHYYARVHCYQAIQKYYPDNIALLSLMPMAMRIAGPKEALWHAIINKNYGCSHFLIGPNHASPPISKSPQNFYTQSSAQDYALKYEKELGIKIIATEETRYVAEKKTFLPISMIQRENLKSEIFTDQDVKSSLNKNISIPHWFSYPEVLKALSKAYPPRCKQGFTLFFTGLSGSGKSTLAKIIYAKMIELGNRPVTLLDGDIVRHNLSSELGFSRNDRNINVRRISFVANEITKNGGIAICAPIAPYTTMRKDARELIEQQGAYIEIFVSTPLEICESRDRKGLYAKARKGIIPEFTGISDPYDPPESAELSIDTTDISPMEAAQQIYLYLFKERYLD